DRATIDAQPTRARAPTQWDGPSLGGLLATAAGGPWRHAYGPLRDWVLGMRVIGADGRVTKAGGRVVKNVAGYDLCRLYVGSLGTLGIIVEATLRLAPLPKARRTTAVALPSVQQGMAMARRLQDGPLRLRSLELVNRPAAEAMGLSLPLPESGLLLLEAAGEEAAVARSSQELSAILGDFPDARVVADDGGDDLWTSLRGLLGQGGLRVQAGVRPSRVAEILEAWQKLGGESTTVVAQPTVGIVHCAWPAAGLERDLDLVLALRQEASRLGGSLTVEACSRDLKERIDVWGETGTGFPLMARIKARFDPQGILNPGRFVGRL
ncbi:MAG TPA: FAD-binding oxidoreductase, partial [Dehalococcoidia bacterium]|nr:FAD-binding oxidoreductase [Dehalococcoidia bacterium]